MGVFFNNIDRKQLKPGDHIYSWRQAYLFAHHGQLFLILFFLFIVYMSTHIDLIFSNLLYAFSYEYTEVNVMS
jgi:hypothetical protein